MSKPASYASVAAIHKKLADYMNKILDEALQEADPDDPDAMVGMPLDAATMGTIGRFVAQNEVSVDPADKDDLAALREKHSKAEQQRRFGKSAVTAAVTSILEDAESDPRLYN